MFEINEPIEDGVIPKPRASDAEPLGCVVAELRFLGDAKLDKSKPLHMKGQSGLTILRLTE